MKYLKYIVPTIIIIIGVGLKTILGTLLLAGTAYIGLSKLVSKPTSTDDE